MAARIDPCEHRYTLISDLYKHDYLPPLMINSWKSCTLALFVNDDSGLSGCIGDSELETVEGDDIVTELSDDWPTYYVPTSNDLPICDSATQGRLYLLRPIPTSRPACQQDGKLSTLVARRKSHPQHCPHCHSNLRQFRR